MRALLIDDENKARKLLTTLLKEYCPQLSEIYEASTLLDGVEIINDIQPELVFLDIEMPEHSGLEILDFFKDEKIDFQIIFITAYNQYAIEAFKMSAVDYLLKPVDVNELKEAVVKAIQAQKQNDVNTNILKLKTSFDVLSKRKLALEVPRGAIFVNHEDVLYFEADGMYTHVVIKNQRKECIAKPLKYFVEQLLENSKFYRPHRSYLVNVEAISEFNKKDGGFLIMEDGKKIAIARDKKEDFFKTMSLLMR